MSAFALSFILAAAPPITSDAYREQLTEGLRRHDAGDLDGALTVYQAMLEIWPHEPTVVYELCLTRSAEGAPSDDLIAFMEAELKVIKKPLPQLYSLLGSLWDGKGELQRGEKWFRLGVSQQPRSADLRFNLGVNLAMQRRGADAEKELVAAAALAPHRPGIWRTLGVLLSEANRRTDSILARATFVLLEPDSERGMTGARAIEPLLTQGITRRDGKIEVSVSNPDDMMLQLLAAAHLGKEDADSEGQFFVKTLTALVRDAQERPQKPTRAAAAKVFLEAQKAGCLEAAAWEVRRAASDPEASKWFETHREEDERFAAFIAPHRRGERGVVAH